MGVTARIIGEETDTAVAKFVTFYTVSINDDGRQWTVAKRYRDFYDLDRQLQGGELSRLELPEKGFFGLRHRLNIGSFNEQRQMGLNLYLGHLTQQLLSLKDSPLLAEFLDERPAAGQRRPSCCTGRPAATEPEAASELTERPRANSSPPSQRPSPPVAAVPFPRTQRAANGNLDFLASTEFRRFESAHAALAGTIRKCAELVVSNRFENDCEAVFGALRRNLRPLQREAGAEAGAELGIGEVPGKDFVWEFVLRVAARRPFFRNQAGELARTLEASPAWAKALEQQQDLRLLRRELL
mmetsp:Transcript_106032/g.299775  ORF Transcript_106032/g.299775 Transcript_106032/m.299775 type:complete len:298 (-) Transcript_106032:61-954(-)